MKAPPFTGIWTALVTPFKDDGNIDWQSLDLILKDQAETPVDGVVVCGTTGETPTLSSTEKEQLISHVIKTFAHSSISVLVGVGSPATSESIHWAKNAEDTGADGLLAVTPYYNKPSQAGLKLHFSALARATKLPIILYNVPSRTGVSLAPATASSLAAEYPSIVGVKEATGNPAITSEILDLISQTLSPEAQRRFTVLSGDDATFLPLLSIGASGVISVASNLFPAAMKKIYDFFRAGQINEALALHKQYYPLFRDLFVESNPVPVKQAMANRGLCEPYIRLPLAPLTPENLKMLERSYSRSMPLPRNL